MCYSKIQKYSPTESAKVYDKAVNRKSKVHFNPRQTLEYLRSDVANRNLSYETKRNIVKQFLDVSTISFFILVPDICRRKTFLKNIYLPSWAGELTGSDFFVL